MNSQHGRLAPGVAMLIGIAMLAASARAHFVLVQPGSWRSQNEFGDPQKVGPCGEEGGGTPTGTETTYRPGQAIAVTIDEGIFHPGHYRVALAVDDRSQLPPPPVVTAVGSDPCGRAEIQDPPVFPVLADNLVPHIEPFAGPQTFTVTLPADVTCTHCTLQVIEYMSSHGRPCYYYHCADIAIAVDATPTPSATPTAPPTVAPTATATDAPRPTATVTPASPTVCPGDCDHDGTVAINELVTAVSIALDAAPLVACAAADADGNQRITIDEILAAVNDALSGCAARQPAARP